MFKFISVIVLFFVAFSTYAANSGVIKSITFSGPNDPSHPNVVQLVVEGGFEARDCSNRFAAMRVSDGNQHLISFAMAAFISKKPVRVVLTPNDKYYEGRCVVARISSAG